MLAKLTVAEGKKLVMAFTDPDSVLQCAEHSGKYAIICGLVGTGAEFALNDISIDCGPGYAELIHTFLFSSVN